MILEEIFHLEIVMEILLIEKILFLVQLIITAIVIMLVVDINMIMKQLSAEIKMIHCQPITYSLTKR